MGPTRDLNDLMKWFAYEADRATGSEEPAPYPRARQIRTLVTLPPRRSGMGGAEGCSRTPESLTSTMASG